MPVTFTPEQRGEQIKTLGDLLQVMRLQDLRAAARLWGWPLRGTAKSELIEQMLGYLADPSRMQAAFKTLPAAEQDSLTWLRALRVVSGDRTRPLHAALRLAGGHKVDESVVAQIVASLAERCLLLTDRGLHTVVPEIFTEWLPEMSAPALASADPRAPVPVVGVEALSRHVDHLLAAIEDDRPPLPASAQSKANPYPTYGQRDAQEIAARRGPLTAESAAQWGYATDGDYDRARFLTWLLLVGGLCRVSERGRFLEVTPTAFAAWQDLSPASRKDHLIAWWQAQSTPAGPGDGSSPPWPVQGAGPAQQPALPIWNELDLALSRVRDHTLKHAAFWVPVEPLIERELSIMRSFILDLLAALQADVWYSFERFNQIVYRTHRDLLHWTSTGYAWNWHRGQSPLDPNQANFEVWQATYGVLVESLLIGPASWLGMVQTALDSGRLVAFRRPSAIVEPPAEPLPADTLLFGPGDTLRLRNLWRASELRSLLRRVAVETARDRTATSFRLDPNAVRKSLHEGRNAAQIIEDFSAARFPLPSSMQNTLRQWQANAGRHQIYDDLAVIEFGDDFVLAELQASTSLARTNVYPVSPRCLLVLQPQTIPGLLEELRRKGYTPQMIETPEGGTR